MIDISKIIRDAIKSEFYKHNFSFPARIIAVSEDGNDVDVKPLISVREGQGYRDLPVIPAVPFLMPSLGNNYGLYFRPKVGFDVIIVCSDYGFDNWIELGGYATESISGRSTMSNAIAICGFNAEDKRRSLPEGSPIIINNNNSIIELSESGEIKLNNGDDYAVKFNELKTAFDKLVAFVKLINVAIPTHVSVVDQVIKMDDSKVEDVRL